MQSIYKDRFIDYLRSEKKMASNSLDAYNRDVSEFAEFVSSKNTASITDVTGTEVIAFLHALKAQDKASSTINRKLASIRSFYNFLQREGIVRENPTMNIKSPKVARKSIDYLEIEEIEKLVSAPDDSAKGKRDRAILETMYATGMRVTEVIDADVVDINLRMGFITCEGANVARARIVPLGRPARNALLEYLENGRPEMIKKHPDEEALFVNVNGARITRQGIWKMLKEYGTKAGVEKKLTPNIIRNSFAVHMLQNVADLKSLQELMGHEDITATQVYLSATKSRIKDVYDRAHPRA